MAQQANLQAATRTTTGKGAARSLRRDGKVPGVIYGHGREAEALTIDTSGAHQDAGRDQRGHDDRRRDRRRPRAGQGADPRDPARFRSARPRSSTSTSTRSGPTRRSPSKCRSTWSASPTACATSAACSTTSLRELEIEVLPGDIPEHVGSRRHRPHHRALALRARPHGREGRRSSTIRHPDLHRRGAARRRGAGRGRGSRRPTEPELIRKAKAEDEDETDRRSDPARHRGAGQPRPGVRGDPAQRRVSIGGSPRRALAARRLRAVASGRGGAKGTVDGRPVQSAQAPDVHEPERRGSRAAPCASGLRSRRRSARPGRRRGPPGGQFRLRGAGSAGGHNGLKSIEGALQRQDYARLRIGVGPVPAGLTDLADFVLGPFEPEEWRAVDALLDPMADAVECWLAEGIERAMSRFNR